MRRKWREVTEALLSLKERGFIDGYLKPRKVASVTIFVTRGVEVGPYSLAEAYAWVEGCEAMGAAAWHLKSPPVPKEEARPDPLRRAIDYLADPESWCGDPHSHKAVLDGRNTPYEVAVEAIGLAYPTPEEARDAD